MKTGLAAILFIAACTSSSNNNGVCGDGTVDDGEQCDDGNTNNGDGCSATCTIETAPVVCGDSVTAGTEQCDDGNTTNGDGCSSTCTTEYKTTANWRILNTGSTTPLACPNGYDTAALYNQLVDANGQPVGQPVIDLFTCADGTGTSGYLPQGVYDTWIAITTQAGGTPYAQTVDALVDLTTGNKTYSADIYKDGGYFAWAWMLQGATSNSALTCAQVQQDGVELNVTVVNSTTAYNDQFSCEDGRGVTAVIPEGSYTVSADVYKTSTGALGNPTNLTNRLIQGPNKITDLGTITLSVDGQ
jgi:cysteine-rich repeat protein